MDSFRERFCSYSCDDCYWSRVGKCPTERIEKWNTYAERYNKKNSENTSGPYWCRINKNKNGYSYASWDQEVELIKTKMDSFEKKDSFNNIGNPAKTKNDYIYYGLDYIKIGGEVQDEESLRLFFRYKKDVSTDAEYFNKKFVEIFEKTQNITNEDFANRLIFRIPSSKPEKKSISLECSVIYLAERFNMIDCKEGLIRHTFHPKQAYGGDRSVDSNLKTMCLSKDIDVSGKDCVVIDDITTSGNSLLAGGEILLQKGARSVIKIVLARTYREGQDEHSLFADYDDYSSYISGMQTFVDVNEKFNN